MKKNIFIIMLMLLTLWFIGCEKETNSSLLSNDAEINEMISTDNEEYFEDDLASSIPKAPPMTLISQVFLKGNLTVS